MNLKNKKRISELFSISENILLSDGSSILKYRRVDEELRKRIANFGSFIYRERQNYEKKYPQTKIPNEFFVYSNGNPIEVFSAIAKSQYPSISTPKDNEEYQTIAARLGLSNILYSKSLLPEETQAEIRKTGYLKKFINLSFAEIIAGFKKDYLLRVTQARNLLLEQNLSFDYENEEEPSYKAFERFKELGIDKGYLNRNQFNSAFSLFMHRNESIEQLINRIEIIAKKINKNPEEKESQLSVFKKQEINMWANVSEWTDRSVYLWRWTWFEEDLDQFKFILPEIFSPRYLFRIHKILSKVLKKYESDIFEKSEKILSDGNLFSGIEKYMHEFSSFKGASTCDVDTRGIIGKKISIIENEMEV